MRCGCGAEPGNLKSVLSSTPSSELAWDGTARLGLGWGLFAGRAGHNQAHAHHAVQIVLSESAQALWVTEADWQPCHGAILAPDVPHRLAESAAPVTLLYLEPDSPQGRQAMQGLVSGWRVLDAETSARALAAARRAGAEQVASAVLQQLCPETEAHEERERDAVIEALIAALPQPLPARISVAALAARAGLSASRLQHRFRSHTGMALRPYLRWRRLLTAMAAVSQGKQLTDSAFEAGFADAAHFSRTFRRHFGISPRVLLQLKPG